jgi:hypothetical protein
MEETFSLLFVVGLYNEDQQLLRESLASAVRRVRRPPACEDVSPRAEERPLLSLLRVVVVGSEKLIAEAAGSSGIQKKGNVRRWK